MGKSFTGALRQVQETRRRSKKRGGGEVGREKREALYAHMRYAPLCLSYARLRGRTALVSFDG